VTTPQLSWASLLLDPVSSALQALLILALVGLVVAREALSQVEPVPRVLGGLARAVHALTPIVVVLIALRLAAIVQ
jgi:hypothetical protein